MVNSFPMASTLFENKSVSIRYHADSDYLFVKWNGFISSDEFRQAASEIIKAVEHTGTKRILSDNTEWKAISPNDHGWAAYNWFPEVEAKGVRKLATLLSTNYFNRAAEKSIEGMADVDCIEIRNFTRPEDALSWLTTSKAPKCA